jgi:hypothetical protein
MNLRQLQITLKKILEKIPLWLVIPPQLHGSKRTVTPYKGSDESASITDNVKENS